MALRLVSEVEVLYLETGSLDKKDFKILSILLTVYFSTRSRQPPRRDPGDYGSTVPLPLTQGDQVGWLYMKPKNPRPCVSAGVAR